ncbi:MAG: hypothetical protein AAB453_03815 [Patescibacteria group bacterium]
MEGIQNYLKKFENLKNPKVIREKLARIILEQTKVVVTAEQIIPKPRSFYLNLLPTTKSFIFQKKKVIEKAFGFPIT